MSSFEIFKKILPNGLTVLTKPSHHIPRVEIHLWYNVGSKDEGNGEYGMAHLLEHMLFKGTKNLSETDINLICQKLTGDANAFTSQDYTCYTFRFPSSVWETALELLSECMINATFNPQMLASELKAVIEEMRLYRENFQGILIENVIAGLFPEHPYHRPIIGSKIDLCSLNRNTLETFYKKHYHPGNAVLVVTGDVESEIVFEAAQKYFGAIKPVKNYQKEKFYFQDDLLSKTTVLRRQVSNPWYCYLYKVPGLKEGKNHLLDIASLILASGKSSRLYQRLVNKDKIALDIDCSVYDFFDKGILFIGVWPTNNCRPEVIEKVLNEELKKLIKKQVQTWEFISAKKKTEADFTSLLESSEKQALVIGNSYLASGNENFIEEYLEHIHATTKEQIQEFFSDYFDIIQEHKGYLLPLTKYDIKALEAIQIESDGLEKQILEKHIRTEPVEDGKWIHTITKSSITPFNYPKPKTIFLDNGIELIYHENQLVPQIVFLITFKANHLYESNKQSGIFSFLLRIMTESIKGFSDQSWAKMLESEGVFLGASGDTIVLRCLHHDFKKTLNILFDVLTKPSFNDSIIEKIRQQLLNDIDELWDSPIDFIDQIAKDLIYKKHPYQKNPLGTKKSIKSLTKKDLIDCYKKFISPHQAVMVVVGNVSNKTVTESVKEILNNWNGPIVKDLTYPLIKPFIPQIINIPLKRDQAVLGFIAPSLSRKDPNYNALAILDIIVCGGSHGSPSSRLFQLREKSGLFYAIGGSLLYGAHEEPGMVFIKTTIATDKVEMAHSLILDTIDHVAKNGVTKEEFEMAKNILFSSSVELFESNTQMAQTFLFLKKMNLNFNLFDKQTELLSILTIEQVNNIAQKYCNKSALTTVHIGRNKDLKTVLSQKVRVR